MICKECNEEKPRIAAGLLSKGHPKYLDHTGRIWRGRRCPACVNAPKIVEEYSHRPCRTCKGKMTKDRYYDCKVCVPELPEDTSEVYTFGHGLGEGNRSSISEANEAF